MDAEDAVGDYDPRLLVINGVQEYAVAFAPA
jgi:hypothetical protein